MPSRVLLTTIPKCGKNLLVAFFNALDFGRQLDDGDLGDAAAHAHARWLMRERLFGRSGHSPEDLRSFLASTGAAFGRTLDMLDGLPDQTYMQGHFPFDQQLYERAQAAGVTVVFLYRDPRACLSSMAHFLVERGEPASLVPHLPSRDLRSAFQLLIDGNEVNPPFASVFTPYDGWRTAPGVISVRFEDIVGPRGNGSMAAQATAFQQLVDGIGWTGARTKLLHGIMSAFAPSAGTFRRGTLDGWRADVSALAGTPAWESLEALARHWGYDDGPLFATPPDMDDVLADLLERVHIEFTEEAAERDQLVVDRDRLEHDLRGALGIIEGLRQTADARDARIEELHRRVQQYRSRAVMRLVDGVAKTYRKLHLSR